ncbi:TatD family deoxyribonuclease [bacterium]|nr:MAG: TatD family deoxyribonuclease [bacterium]
MIDTHAHIYLPQFEEQINEVLDRAIEAGLTDILMPGIHEESWQQMARLPQRNDIKLHKMFGIHPCDVEESVHNYYDLLMNYCKRADVIAIGETGLDYYWSTERVHQQKESLRIHCVVAKELKKPIVLHNRESTTDLLNLIEEEQDGTLTGVWHCFTGNIDEGKRAIDLGLHLGIGGVLTFKNGGIDKIVPHLPVKSLLLETDSPFLAPSPHRGKQNEPAYTKLVADKLSVLINLPLTEIIQITDNNSKKLFKLA